MFQVDMSVDYITPVGHEVVVKTENISDELNNDNIIGDYDDANNEVETLNPPHQFGKLYQIDGYCLICQLNISSFQ